MLVFRDKSSVIGISGDVTDDKSNVLDVSEFAIDGNSTVIRIWKT